MPPLSEQDVRRIIREELGRFILSDRFFIQKNMQFADGVSIQTGLTNGLKIGGTASEMISLHGVTPVVQAGAISTPTAPSGTYVQAEAASAKTAIDAIRVALTGKGITA